MPDSDVFLKFLWAFLVLVPGSILLFIPEEVPVVASGVWVASSPEYGLSRWLILPVCIGSIILCDMLLYSIGRHWGSRLLDQRWLARLITPERRARIQRNFHRYGTKMLLFVRWIPGIRTPLFLTAGTMRLSVVRFLVADSIAAAAGHTLLFFLSYWFTDSFLALFQRVEGDVSRVGPLVTVVSILVVGLYLLVHFLRKPVATGDPQEVPLIGSQVAAKIESPEPEQTAPPSANNEPAHEAAEKKPVSGV